MLKAKAILPIKIDAEKRRWGQEKGLETLVPLTVNDEWWLLVSYLTSGDANALTIPPCEYDCKVENKKISRSRSKRSEACYLIR